MVGERGERRHRRHDDRVGAREPAAREAGDEAADRVREPGLMQGTAQHEDRGDDDRRLARESGERLGRRQEAGAREGEHDERRDDVVAQPLRDEQRERRHDDREERELGPGQLSSTDTGRSDHATRSTRSERAWHSTQRVANGSALSRFGAIGSSHSTQMP